LAQPLGQKSKAALRRENLRLSVYFGAEPVFRACLYPSQQLKVRGRDHGHKRLSVPSNDNPIAALDTVEQLAEVATRVGNGDGRFHTLIFGKDGNSFIRVDPRESAAKKF
jgi:hypothetical protein